MSAQNVSHEACIGVCVISAGVMDMLGIPLQPIVWALFGGIFGSPLATATKWYMMPVIYLASALLSALFGQALALKFFDGGAIIANVMSAGIAILFHPLLSAGVQATPELVKRAINWLPGGAK